MLLRQHMVRRQHLQLKKNMGLAIFHPAHLCETHCMQTPSRGAAELRGCRLAFFKGAGCQTTFLIGIVLTQRHFGEELLFSLFA